MTLTVPRLEWQCVSPAPPRRRTTTPSLTLPAQNSNYEDGIRQTFADLLHQISELLTDLDSLVHAGCPTFAPDINRLLYTRTAIQHALCRLRRTSPPPLYTTVVPLPDVLHSACHATLLLLADVIWFPIPLSVGVRPRLLQSLAQTLCRCERLGAWDHARGFMFWAATVGAVTSPWQTSTASSPSAFTDMLRARVFRDFASWRDFHQHLVGFVWWDHLLDAPGRAVWLDVCMPASAMEMVDGGSYGDDYICALPGG